MTRSVVFILLLSGHLIGFTQETEFPFAGDIRKFLESDSLNPPPHHAIVFAGSSSFTMWQDVGDYFPGYSIINRGFGGSTLVDQVRYASRIIIPYRPLQVVIYCGENDFAASDTVTVDMVAARFRTLFELVRSGLPEAKITYVSIKPSPSRWNLAPKFYEANREIRKYIRKQHNAGYVSIWNKMLNKEHLPDSTLFLPDRLHMNARGYQIWQKAIKPTLIFNN